MKTTRILAAAALIVAMGQALNGRRSKWEPGASISSGTT